MSVQGLAEGRVTETTARRAEPRSVADRDNPSLYDAMTWDPVTPIPAEIRADMATDLQRWTHKFTFPVVRVLVTFAIWVVIFLKRIIPLRLGSERLLSASTMWFARHFASPEAQRIVLRHFNIESQIINFVARNVGREAGPGAVPECDLLPRNTLDMGDWHGRNAVALHDANVMNLFIDLGRSGVDVDSQRSLSELDFSMLEMPELTVFDGRKWMRFDLPSVLYISVLMIMVFFDDKTIERAVNSFQFDEPLLGAVANLTGDEALRTLTPVKFTTWLGSPTGDISRDLHWHILAHEMAYERLLRLKRTAEAGQG